MPQWRFFDTCSYISNLHVIRFALQGFVSSAFCKQIIIKILFTFSFIPERKIVPVCQ